MYYLSSSATAIGFATRTRQSLLYRFLMGDASIAGDDNAVSM